MAPTLSYDDIVFACTNLCDLIELENDALSRHDFSVMKELADSKSALAKIYEQSVTPMTEDPSLLDDLDPDAKEELLRLGQKLQILVEDNARMLKAEMEANRRLMDVMVAAVKSQATNNVTYGNRGSFDLSGTGDRNSISFNKSL